MTHPTNTAILSDKQRKEFIRRAGFISEADRDMRAAFVDEIAAAVIEKLATGDAVPVAWRHAVACSRFGQRHEFSEHGAAYPPGQPLYDATALAAARQQGRNEGREEARAEFGPLFDRLRASLKKGTSHSHHCLDCGTEYTPDPGECEDCPNGCDDAARQSTPGAT